MTGKKGVKDLKNVSGNYLDDDELDGVVGGYNSVVEIMPDSSGQGMQCQYLPPRDTGAVALVSSSDDIVEHAKEFCGLKK